MGRFLVCKDGDLARWGVCRLQIAVFKKTNIPYWSFVKTQNLTNLLIQAKSEYNKRPKENEANDLEIKIATATKVREVTELEMKRAPRKKKAPKILTLLRLLP